MVICKLFLNECAFGTMDIPVLGWIPAEFYIGPVCSVVQPGLGHLHWGLFVLDGLGQILDILLHASDIFNGLLTRKHQL